MRAGFQSQHLIIRDDTAGIYELEFLRLPLDIAINTVSGYAWFVVAVLVLASLVSFVDRQVIALLVTALPLAALAGTPIDKRTAADPAGTVEISNTARNHILNGLRVFSSSVPDVRLV